MDHTFAVIITQGPIWRDKLHSILHMESSPLALAGESLMTIGYSEVKRWLYNARQIDIKSS